MQFRNPYTFKANIGQPMSETPCTEFTPNQGKTIAQVIQDYVRGIPMDSVDVNSVGYQTPQEAAQAERNRAISRTLPVDDSYILQQVRNTVKRLENVVSSEQNGNFINASNLKPQELDNGSFASASEPQAMS